MRGDVPMSKKANGKSDRQLSNKRYDKELKKLQLDLVKMQEWIVQNR